ncbi:MAG: hypothetical protein NC548_31520 [Lachnospiraceae bacterium]|nr:hypothetical protein [Lachnospiraceae bacterium]
MTSLVKMPYYPKIAASCMETTFGALEISCPLLYETPIDGLCIVRVDLLECLRDILGENCMMYRDMCYKLVSGSCTTQQEHIEIFSSAYRRFSRFTKYVNDVYYYGESDIPIIPRVLNPVREIIEKYRDTVMNILVQSGGKFLTNTHDYLYFAYKGTTAPPVMKGLTVIC